jgi:hypothetical protein
MRAAGDALHALGKADAAVIEIAIAGWTSPACGFLNPANHLRGRPLLRGIAILLALSALAGAAAARDYHSNPWLLSWIPSQCCVTNDCCWEIAERELRPLPDDPHNSPRYPDGSPMRACWRALPPRSCMASPPR